LLNFIFGSPQFVASYWFVVCNGAETFVVFRADPSSTQRMCQRDFPRKTDGSAQALLSFGKNAAHELRDSEIPKLQTPNSKFQVNDGG
jgi:hypothetical protein